MEDEKTLEEARVYWRDNFKKRVLLVEDIVGTRNDEEVPTPTDEDLTK